MSKLDKLDWDKGDGLLPAIVQNATTAQILMLGYMNKESLAKTQETKLVTFYSRSRQELWTKGETSGNTLELISLHVDCDFDTILVKAKPNGPVCHTGAPTCFFDDETSPLAFLGELSALLHQRNLERPEGSYTTSLFEAGKARIAQKVGEEGVEVSLAAMQEDKQEILDEGADLLYHLGVLLEQNGLSYLDLVKNLQSRHK